MIKYLPQFTLPWLHARAKEQLLHPKLDWNYPTFAESLPGVEPNYEQACFGRCSYDFNSQVNNWAGTESLTYVLEEWLDRNSTWFKIHQVHRCHMNFYSRGQCTTWHTDHLYPDMYGLLYYIDDSTGGTEFKDASFNHKENTGVFFNANLLHRPIPSDRHRRITVSWILAGTILNDQTL